jgi:hypothetical protein
MPDGSGIFCYVWAIHAQHEADFVMKEVFEALFAHFGNYLELAGYLKYSDRQCRNIRRKIEQGIPLRPQVEQWIRTQYENLKNGRG